MPMDIRHFFAKKGAAPPKSKPSSSSGKDNSSNKAKAAKTTSKDKASYATSFNSSSKSKISKVAPSSKKQVLLSPVAEEGPVIRKKAAVQKRKIIDDDDDDSDDATTEGDFAGAASSTKAKTKNNDKETDDSETTDGESNRKPAAAVVAKKKTAPTKPKNLKEVSASDFFVASSKSNSNSSRRSSPRIKNKPKRSIVDVDDDAEFEEEEEKKASKKNDSMLDDDDDDDEFDDSGKPPVDKKQQFKKLKSPEVAKLPPNKPLRKASPAKRQRLLVDDDIDDDNDTGDDEAHVDVSKDDDDDYEEEPSKKATPPSPRKKRGAFSAATKKSPPVAADNKDETPPSSKKRKTQPSSSKTKPPVKKEAPLAPTLELESFDANEAVSECMAGTTFVFTGVMEGLSRDAGMDFVKILGGRVTTSVSGKTSYLVVGEVLEDGRPYDQGKKYQKAVQLGSVHIVMGEKRLYGLAKLYNDKAKALQPLSSRNDKENNGNQPSPVISATASSSSSKIATNPYVVANPYKKAPVANPYLKNKVANPYDKTTKPASLKNDDDYNENLSAPKNNLNALWVDRYAPSSTRDVLGNRDQVNKLITFLARWEARFNNDKSVGKAFSNPQGPWKAALLSGPPGIGKTTSATLVAKEAGRDLIEFNASDVRSKKHMHENLGDICGSKSVQAYFQQNPKVGGCTGGKPSAGLNTKRCIIMDEVDGMGGGDRGGVAELIQMIKNSRVPIICICNDRQSQKIKSLLPYCLDLKFKRPIKSQIAKAAIKIAAQEGLQVEQNAAEAIAESCGNDIRQVLNCLQMWASDKKNNKNNTMTYKGLKDRENVINKDAILRVSLFDASRLILEGRRNLSGVSPEEELSSFFKRNDAFFVDYSFTGLIVQQNYLKVMSQQFNEIKRKNDEEKSLDFLERVHSAAQSMSDYTMVENKIRGGSDMNWSLLPFSGVLAVKTGFHAAGPIGAGFPGFPEFTTWLGRNSSKGKKLRILQELNHHMNYKISGGTQEVRLSYVPFLRQRFFSQFNDSQDEDRNTVAIQLMDDYGLDRDDVFENLDEFNMNAKGPKFADIDTKSKAAFTREYNKLSHKSQALVEEQGAPSKKKKGGVGGSVDPEDPDAINDDAQAAEDDDDDDDEEDDIEQLKAAFKKKGRQSLAAKTTNKGKAKGKSKKK